MKVTVLYGGPSAEREVSLVSGKAVIDGLRSTGHEVFASDVSPTDLSGLDHPADVVFPVLHGQFGESGELQEILEPGGLAFVGSGSAASRLGMDKVETKKAWIAAGLPTPAFHVVTAAGRPPAPSARRAWSRRFPAAAASTSTSARRPPRRRHAIAKVVKSHGRALVEQFIRGPELTVGLLEEQPLAPHPDRPEATNFSTSRRSTRRRTRSTASTPACRRRSWSAAGSWRGGRNAVVGARDLARIDIMLDAGHNPYLLEINTLPGFTPKSLLPEAAKHAGIDFGPLVDRLVRRAAARHASH